MKRCKRCGANIWIIGISLGEDGEPAVNEYCTSCLNHLNNERQSDKTVNEKEMTISESKRKFEDYANIAAYHLDNSITHLYSDEYDFGISALYLVEMYASYLIYLIKEIEAGRSGEEFSEWTSKSD